MAETRFTRRRWLALAAVGALLRPARSRGGRDDTPGAVVSDPEGLDAIRLRAAEAGLPDLRAVEGERFVALGTARADFMDGALSLCEGLADDYLGHFQERGFAVEPPSGRMAMVALADAGQFGRFLGVEQAPDVTGVYEPGPNYLVLYDGRSGSPAGTGPAAERANTITLFHEATHQLTFNTGLLDRGADIPLVVSEGLAMYGETRRPGGRSAVGDLNRERLAVIADAFDRGGDLLPLADLVAGDGPYQQAETVQLAYAQSWLFVYGLIRNDQSVGRLQGYLGALKGPEGGRPRVELAEEHLGDLGALDARLRAFAGRLIRGRG